jgi:hypothetical protein
MATLSITVLDSAVPRIRAAVGNVTGLPGPATVAQVEDLVRKYLRGLCVQVERSDREAAAPTAAETAVTADFPDA